MNSIRIKIFQNSYWGNMIKLIKKDLLLPFRSIGFLISYVLNNFLMLIIFSMATESASIEVINGIFWAVLFLNSILFCLKLMEDEFLEESFYVLLTYYPIEEIVLSKLIVSSLYLLAIGFTNLLFLLFLFANFHPNIYILMFLFLSSISISSIAIVLSLMLFKVGSKNILIYLLYLPLSIPIFLSATNGTIDFKLDWFFLSLICSFLYTSILLFYSEKAIL